VALVVIPKMRLGVMIHCMFLPLAVKFALEAGAAGGWWFGTGHGVLLVVGNETTACRIRRAR
jgi:hypothetical protein